MNEVQQAAEGAGDRLESPAACQPLSIIVTGGAKEQMALRTLAREAVPMLRRPEGYTGKQRHRLAQAFAELLDVPYGNDAEERGAGEDEEGGEWP